jgi:shikimate kinase
MRTMHRPSSDLEPNVLLIGFTGAGKSTVGAELAARLRRIHFDVDQAIEAQLGSIPAFVERHGVRAFRLAERRVIAERLPLGEAVVSAGAGSVLPLPTRSLLCDRARVFFLDVPAPVLAARLAGMAEERRHRPDLMLGDAVGAIAAELDRRRPLYLDLGTRVDGTASPGLVADSIVARLRAAAPV